MYIEELFIKTKYVKNYKDIKFHGFNCLYFRLCTSTLHSVVNFLRWLVFFPLF